ncbi:hypothetical protein N0V93_007287 [Gnomoniopsis smithogilvyi]|uniref:Uncharacterized protein n=1 Tax=Gnomoniopsis smithogilvyi TaxID=1191159 RepID=A0A9W8YQ67_9PEZI|nr:hypothetical protein N0V93_007287 [Gnomoniopsis smithogilvyi]
MASPPAVVWRTVDENHIKDIYDSDQVMYPAPQLTYGRLKSWVDACPEICLCLQRGNLDTNTHPAISPKDAILGLVVVLPLRQPSWDRLLRGEIEEHDIDAAEMFPAPPNSEIPAYGEGSKIKVGLHVFHIERFPEFASFYRGKSFTTLALDEVRGRVMDTFQSWEVVGYSALTASKQGNAAFKRLGFLPSNSSSRSTLLHQDAEMVERRGNGPFSGS